MNSYPPLGHHFSYHFQFEPEPGSSAVPLEFQMTVPSAMTNLHVSTLRVTRAGGPTQADERFRARLHAHIGTITVASGHVEAAMKRLLLLLEHPDGTFGDVDLVWSDLVKRLERAARTGAGDGRRKRLAKILAWADDNRLKWHRDNAVHSYWWPFDGDTVICSRFRRKEDGETIFYTFSALDEAGARLAMLADHLDELLGEDWGRAILPAMP